MRREPPDRRHVGAEFRPVEETRRAESPVDTVTERVRQRGARGRHVAPERTGDRVLLFIGERMTKSPLCEGEKEFLDARLVRGYGAARRERRRVSRYVVHRRLREAIGLGEEALADAYVTVDGRELAFQQRRPLFVLRDDRGGVHSEQRRVRVEQLVLGQADDAFGRDDRRP